MNNPEKWIWLSEALYKGGRKANDLLSRFGGVSAIYDADRETLLRSGISLSEKELSRLLEKDLSRALKILSDCEKDGIRIILRSSPEFPSRLLQIADCPPLLYAKGKPLNVDSEPVISVVGTRRASAQGKSAAKKISSEIAACGGVVCSGMAKGIDTISMEAALSSGGKVIAVLGCGPDIVYPAENRELMKRTEHNGTVVSEYPPKTPPDKINFPQRNRIISALSCGVVIIEAPEKSGALITARIALEQNKDIFAVPSGIFEPVARGSNNLIRMGAAPIASGSDVMSEYVHLFPGRINLAATPEMRDVNTPSAEDVPFSFPPGFLDSHSPDERAILLAIGGGEVRADKISAECNMPIAKVLSLLTILEIRKSVVQLPGTRFKIRNF